jgi:mono/diheme cytochrome c family protein
MLLLRPASRVSGSIFVGAVIFLLPTSAALAAASGEEVYAKRCASCHDQTNPRIPSRDSLKKIPATRILKVLDFGVMMQVAYQLTRQERDAVANFLGTESAETALAPEAFCGRRRAKYRSGAEAEIEVGFRL